VKILYFDLRAGLSLESLLGSLLFSREVAERVKEAVSAGKIDGLRLGLDEKVAGGVRAIEAKITLNGRAECIPPCAELCLPAGASALVEKIRGRVSRALLHFNSSFSRELALDRAWDLNISLNTAAIQAALSQLRVDKVTASPLPVGPFGRSSASAGDNYYLKSLFLLEVARGAAVVPGEQGPDMFPTAAAAAALLAELADHFGPLPGMVVEEVGYGCCRGPSGAHLTGSVAGRSLDDRVAGGCAGTVTVLETSIDDMNPQLFPFITEKLLRKGALDAFVTPIYMKKGRPACLVTCLCRPQDRDNLLRVIFRESTTLGVRVREETRCSLLRRFFKVTTPYGAVNVKAGYLKNSQGVEEVFQFAPEFEECRKLAEAAGVPLKEVYNSAMAAAREVIGCRGVK